MKRAPYMPFWIADYEADTTDLTTEEHGAYLLLIMAAWKTGGKLPSEDSRLAAIAKMSTRRWKAISARIRTYFQDHGDHITQKRVSREIDRLGRKSSSASKSAKTRWKYGHVLNENSEVGDASALRTDMPSDCDGNANGDANAMLYRYSPKGEYRKSVELALSPEVEALNRAPLRSGFGGAQ